MLAATAATWFSIKYTPAPMLFVYLSGAIIADLITGLLKSWKKGKATTSIGLRATITKMGVYSMVIVGSIIIVNVLHINSGASEDSTLLLHLMNWLLSFMVFIECYSVFENVGEAYPNSLFVKYVVNPVLKLLKGRLEAGKDFISQSKNQA